jgi:hypothetical protein
MEDAVEPRGPVTRMQGPLGETAAAEMHALGGMFAPARCRQPTDSFSPVGIDAPFEMVCSDHCARR